MSILIRGRSNSFSYTILPAQRHSFVMHCPVSLRCISSLTRWSRTVNHCVYVYVLRSETWQINNVNISWRIRGKEREKILKKKRRNINDLYKTYHFDRLILYALFAFSMGNSQDDDYIYCDFTIFKLYLYRNILRAQQFNFVPHTYKRRSYG